MAALKYEITAREKWHDFAFSEIADFTLAKGWPVPMDSLLSDPNVSLYSLDLETRSAVFAVTPGTLNLETAAFMFRGQFEQATHVVTVPFDTFHELAAQIAIEEPAVLLIHSVGRCGSTLVSKAFEALPQVRSLSEPDALTLIVNWRGSGALDDAELQRLTRSSIAFCCKPLTGKAQCTHWALKFRSQCTEICDLMAKAFPEAKHLYLTREPVSWLGSAYRAFIDPEQAEAREYKELFENLFGEIFPLVRSLRKPGEPMSVSKVWMLNWISNMESQRRFKQDGIDFCEADFSEIKSHPEETIRRLFKHCGIAVEDPAALRAALQRDSQAGSSIAQETINRPEKRLPERNLEEARQLLRERGHIA